MDFDIDIPDVLSLLNRRKCENDIDNVLRQALHHMAEPTRHNFLIMYRWFMGGEEKPGPRLLGKRIPGVAADFSHCAQRGIHVPKKKWFPTGKRYAASVTARVSSIYGEIGSGEPCIQVGDGTWLLLYSAHMNNSGKPTDPTWNEGLLNCMNDGLPVGVFRQVGSKADEYIRSLAWVESFDEKTQTFVIHGPINEETANTMCQNVDVSFVEFDGSLPSLKDLEKDTRVFKEASRAIRNGQAEFRAGLINAYGGHCAITGCRVERVLQAAHIVEYRGKASNRVQNGLLLREDVHTLYDNALLGINPVSLEVEIVPSLKDTEYEELGGRRLLLPADPKFHPNKDYLAVRYRKFDFLKAS